MAGLHLHVSGLCARVLEDVKRFGDICTSYLPRRLRMVAMTQKLAVRGRGVDSGDSASVRDAGPPQKVNLQKGLRWRASQNKTANTYVIEIKL